MKIDDRLYLNLVGCHDGNCLINPPKGMHTNGGCQCEKELRRSPYGLEAIRTIHYLRSALAAEYAKQPPAIQSAREEEK